MDSLLSDQSTYKVINRDPLTELQCYTYEILKNLNDYDFSKYKFQNDQLTMTKTF